MPGDCGSHAASCAMGAANPGGRSELTWMTRAACRAKDPELFFPISENGPGAVQVAEAKAVCRGCPVREFCLDYAVTTGQEAGIWGGLTPAERRLLRGRASLQPRWQQPPPHQERAPRATQP